MEPSGGFDLEHPPQHAEVVEQQPAAVEMMAQSLELVGDELQPVDAPRGARPCGELGFFGDVAARFLEDLREDGDVLVSALEAVELVVGWSFHGVPNAEATGLPRPPR